ncbi:MAG TPA: multicopper oxidase domain-containing protein [Thermoanaerobaculia bacterium]|nr:multicopper oxidase domain-containing protein [Thermoanaerobaculia bacterium]
MAQNVVIPPCGNQGKVELEFPTEITATGHVLDTVLDMVPKIKMVPVLKTGTTVTCIEQPFELRLYKDPKTGELKYPGPTLRVRRATATEPGDRIRVRLENHLKANGDPGCVWEKASKELCNCSAAVPPEKKPQCCNNDTEPNEALMACFHGANDSNLHFHGTHASPQEPQDWVLLQLQPYGTTVGPETQPMGDPSTVRQGSFQYDINPLPDNQAEGTHWYHPHKHGSTAEQVGNGLAGALIVEGPFDDWLRKQLPDLREKLMVIQEIHDLNFTSRLRAGTPMPLINGQLTPKITMNPGEIQRWRLIGATMEASAQLVIDFNGLVSTNRTQAMQIAMDGIQFSPNNYYCQPLLDPSPCDGKLNDQKFRLSPGNRADFLVKADPANAGQELLIPYEVFGRVERQGQKPLARSKQLDRVRVEEVRAALDALAPGAAQPALLRVYVCKPGSTAPEDKGCKNMAMQFPSTLPPLPSFLRDINPRPGATQTVQFQVVEPGTTSPPFPDGQFQIFVQGKNDNKAMQFNENCAVFNEPLDPDGGEQWTVSQNLNDAGDAPFHVFHIHTNPFQVMSTFVGGKEVSYNTCPPPAGKPSYACMTPIWQDSLTLPDNNKGSLPANQPDGYMVIRQRFEDYTGPYVLHCHFLGHEDRGMMLTVQTVCPNHEPNEYSETSTTQKECTFGKFIKALPLIDTPECKSATEKAAMMITHAAHERKKKQ